MNHPTGGRCDAAVLRAAKLHHRTSTIPPHATGAAGTERPVVLPQWIR